MNGTWTDRDPWPAGPTVLAIGNFDGLHLGHRAVLQAAQDQARQCDAATWMLTFDPHPVTVLCPDKAPHLLLSTDQKVKQGAKLGLQGILVMPFTPELAAQSPQDFTETLLRHLPELRAISVGQNWRFGHKAHGTADGLRAYLAPRGIEVLTAGPVLHQGRPISSSRIRTALEQAELSEANALLGRNFSLFGPVVHGHKVGRKLGFPTANLAPDTSMRPAAGIYAGRAHWRDQSAVAAIYIGQRPTFASKNTIPVVEAFLLDARDKLDLYNCSMQLEFIQFVRLDQTFAHPRELKLQIQRDVDAIRQMNL